MDNNNSTTPYSTANPEEFKMEIISLLNKLNDQIKNSTSKTDIYNTAPTKKLAVNTAILKTHEFKLKEGLEFLESMEPEHWIEYKADLIRDFDAAYKALQPKINR